MVYARPQTLIPPDKFEVAAAQPGFAYGTAARGRQVSMSVRRHVATWPDVARCRSPAPPAARQAQQMPGIRKPADHIFRATVEMVSLNVTVVDSGNRYVTDLDKGDFGVFEDGAKQEITYFNRTSLPIALSLLLDTSASMEQRMVMAQDAAIGFAKRLRPQDLAQVVDFDTRVEVLQASPATSPPRDARSTPPRPAARPRSSTRSTSR